MPHSLPPDPQVIDLEAWLTASARHAARLGPLTLADIAAGRVALPLAADLADRQLTARLIDGEMVLIDLNRVALARMGHARGDFPATDIGGL